MPAPNPYWQKLSKEEQKKLHGARAEKRKKGLEVAAKDIAHLKSVVFIPCRFVIQRHWWGKKTHWDVRVQKIGAVTWFGFTLFSSPFKVSAEAYAKGTVKGYETLAVEKHEGKPKKESLGELRWMSFEGKLPVGSPGNPTKNFTAYMVIEDKGLLILHRRELDFIDLTFLGKKIKGRYFYRLVKQLKTEKEPSMNFYFRKGKEDRQPDLTLMEKLARKTKLTGAEILRVKTFSSLEKKKIRSSK